MSAVIDFVQGWSKLIIELWIDHPVVGAIVTLAAVGLFALLEQQRNSSGDTTVRRIHIVAAVLAWVVVVPILGFFTDAVAKVIAGAWAVVTFFYANFKEQPLFVLGALGLAAIIFVVWEWRVKPRQPLVRGTLVLVGFFVVIGLGVPLITSLSPSATDKTPVTKASAATK